MFMPVLDLSLYPSPTGGNQAVKIAIMVDAAGALRKAIKGEFFDYETIELYRMPAGSLGVERPQRPGIRLVCRTSQWFFIDNDVTPGDWAYEARMVSKDGTTSAWSAPATITVLPPVVREQPVRPTRTDRLTRQILPIGAYREDVGPIDGLRRDYVEADVNVEWFGPDGRRVADPDLDPDRMDVGDVGEYKYTDLPVGVTTGGRRRPPRAKPKPPPPLVKEGQTRLYQFDDDEDSG